MKAIIHWSLLLFSLLAVCCLIESRYENTSTVEYSRIYYVSENVTLCQKNGGTCHSLQFYMNKSRSFFENDTAFFFLPGDHHTDVNTSLSVSNVSTLLLRAYSDPVTIQCQNHNNHFSFHKVNNLMIENLTFSECGEKKSEFRKGYPTLIFKHGIGLTVHNVKVLKSAFQGIASDNSIGNISFIDVTVQDSKKSKLERHDSANLFYFSYCPCASHVNIKNSKFERVFGSLTLVIKCDNVEVVMDDLVMDSNHGNDGTLALIYKTANLWNVPGVVLKNSNIANNHAEEGGGLFVYIVQPVAQVSNTSVINHTKHENIIVSVLNTHFVNNSAHHLGGAISIRQKESLNDRLVGDIIIHGCTFKGNFLKKGGQGATAINSLNFVSTRILTQVSPQFRTFVQSCNFSGHYVKKNKWNSSGCAVIFAKSNTYFLIRDVIVDSNNSTAIQAMESNLILKGTISLFNNSASSGGGFLLCQTSVLFLECGVNVFIFDNRADTGGGIAVESVCLLSKPICFFQLASPKRENYDNVTIRIYNNTARYAGDNLYGGFIGNCYMIESYEHNTRANKSLSVFNKVFDIEDQGPGLPSVTSAPTHVCLCENGVANCNITHHFREDPVYAGQEFTLEFVVVGQLDGAVPGIVQVHIDTKRARIDPKSIYQKSLTSRCQNFTYAILANKTSGNVKLVVEAAQQGDISVTKHLRQFRHLYIDIPLTACPCAFEVKHGTCACDSFIAHLNNQFVFPQDSIVCNITKNSISSPQDIWIGYVNDNTSTIPEGILLFSIECPSKYCKPNIVYVSSDLNRFNQDIQCHPNLTGIMCGRCKHSRQSVQLGGHHCNDCSNYNLFLIIPFALVGIFFVFLLILLNITVSDGTINGIIFYAHIVQSQSPLLKNIWSKVLLKFCTISIAWLNLELGLRVCFFEGMTEHHKAWLQFVFPIYIFVILAVLVILSRRWNCVTRLVGRNAVKVFATLILLSYPKLCRAIIASLNFIRLYGENGQTYYVWAGDGNVLYLGSERIPIIVFSVILAIVCLPFTLSLLFVQILERYSHYRVFYFVLKFKPLFDAYTGPYTSKARFWTGFLLLIRIAIFVLSTPRGFYLYSGTSSIIGFSAFILFLFAVIRPGIYKSSVVNILECSSILNLIIFFIARAHLEHKSRDKVSLIFMYVSIFIELFMFYGVVAFHIWKKVSSLQPVRNIIERVKQRCLNRYQYRDIDHQGEDDLQVNHLWPPFERYNQDREPLLAESH